MLTDTSVIPKLKAIINSRGMKSLLTYNFLYIGIGYMGSIFIPPYAARWFAHCDENTNYHSHHSGTSEDCKLDYVSYNFYNTLFISIRGLLLFITSGIIGRLSDAYGRRLFLLLNTFLSTLPYLFIGLFGNVWYYFVFNGLIGLSGI